MNLYQRTYAQELAKRMSEPRMFMQVVYGPRQVGKTTLVRQMQKHLSFESSFLLADNVPAVDTGWIKRVWDEARLKLARSPGSEFLLIIDEIQKIENWSEAVKKEWDTDTIEGRDLKVILLGSSRLLLQQGLTESLAGRFEATYIPHWSYTEMRDAFGYSLEQYVWHGAYPGAVPLIKNRERWTDYIRDSLVETSISRDIIMLTKIDKPALLRRLFEIGCVYSAKLVSLTKVQGNLQERGNITTLANYLQLLDGAGLLAGLEKYSGNAIRKRSSVPKFQVYNNALLNQVLNLTLQQAKADHELWGQIMESAVGAHLLNHSITEKYCLYYWNEKNHEVDFVLEKENVVIGLEVKSGKESTSLGLSVFCKQFNPEHVFTIGTDGISFEEFFTMNPRCFFEI
ncbi:MAG: ATP-binding protein [Odoribacteraceae bacterium]|jgi:predicted AAA+ superfamily ATPase|nr:ATP-binding protein [Odoribacteraceae bacterium]